MSAVPQPLLQAIEPRVAQRRDSRIPIVVLVLMLAFTTLATCFVWFNSRGHQENAFQRSCEVVRMQIRSSLQTYLAYLRGAAGLFAASEEVSAEEFQRYFDRLQITTLSPGIQGFGFSIRVRPENAEQILELARTQVLPEYHFWADYSNVEQHAILYLQPQDDRNRRALGYDMHAEPIRGKAMDTARDSGRPAATGAVTLKQEVSDDAIQAGFLVYVPVYEDGRIPASIMERREKLVGFVYAAFRAADFMNAATRPSRLKQLGFEVYDQGNAKTGLLLFAHPQTEGKMARLERSTFLRWAQHRWTLRFSGDVNLGLAAPHIIVPSVALSGLSLSVLFWGVTRRITSARRQAEENAELAAQGRRLFERIAEATPDVLYVHDVVRHRNVYVNRQVAAVLGLKPDEIQAIGTDWARTLMHADDRLGAFAYQQAITKLQDGEIATHEARFRHANGSYRWVFLRSCVFTRASNGEVQQILGVGSDITERRATEEALRAASRSKDEFLAALSHELRTPLTPVLAIVSGLEKDSSLSEDARAELAMARRNVELEARLIDDLLDLTRVARGKLIMHLEPVDLREVIEHATASVVELREKSIRFSLEWNASEHQVWGDRSRLVQLFWNILKNAGKFTHFEGRVWLRVRNEHPKNQERPQVVIECEDEGIGIPPETLPRIFNAFEQGDSRVTRQFGGLGLGLAISKAVAELHHGELVATSEGSGLGATFTLRLPTIPITPSVPESPAPVVREMGVGQAGAGDEMHGKVEPISKPVNLLLVEDHPDTAEILAKRLRRIGHRVTHAGTVAAALAAAEDAMAKQQPFELVLSDLGLPDGTGFELMQQLTKRYGLRGIALSGFGMDADVQRSAESGFARHLTKPVDFEILKEAITSVQAHGDGQSTMFLS